MIGFFFGVEGAERFGVLAPAVGGRRPARGALLCAPFGQEMIRAHRAHRVLAERLAAAGVPAIRFDYAGTGDSWGESGTGTLDDWHEDATRALDELLDGSDVRRAVVIGQRLGALTALQLAAERSEVDRLVLWDPSFDAPCPASDAPVEQDGFLVQKAFAQSVEQCDYRALAQRVRAKVLVIGDTEPLVPTWQHEVSTEPPAWQGGDYLGAGRLPAQTLARIVEFCK